MLNVYASYGIGFRSGGFNAIGTEDLLNFWFNAGFGGPGEVVDAQITVNDDYDKEVSTAYEIGVKSEWLDRRLRLNAAVFRTMSRTTSSSSSSPVPSGSCAP
jgi:iron complex outermembrane receptor protein